VPDNKVTRLASLSFPSGTTGASPEAVLVADRRLRPISQERLPQIHSSRDTERVIATLSPVSGAVSIANSNSSAVSNSSTSVVDGSSSTSNQNIATAFTKTLPAQAITAGAVGALNGMVLVGPHSSGPMALPQDRVVANGAAMASPETISRPPVHDVHSSREVERIVSALAPGSVAPSSATSNLSVISDSSSTASDNSSRVSVQNIAAALEKTAPVRAFAGGTEAAPAGVIMVGEPIGMPHDRAFAGGTREAPPGTVLVGENGPELVSQPGGLHVYTHRETEKILSAMPQVNGYAATGVSHYIEKPNVISLAVAREGLAAKRSFTAGVKSTPAGVILVGEQGPELVATPGAMQPHGPAVAGHTTAMMAASSTNVVSLLSHRGFWQGTSGQYHQTMPAVNYISAPAPRIIGFADGTSGQYDGMLPAASINNVSMSKVIGFWSGTSGQYDRLMPATNVVTLSSNRELWSGTSGQYDRIMPTAVYNNISMPKISGFADGTSGQEPQLIAPPNFSVTVPQGSASPNAHSNEEVRKLLKEVVSAVNVNNHISRLGHYETGQELKTQTNELRKPAPHQPARRRVA
jgi:nitrogen fixation-related uncharacterized protein